MTFLHPGLALAGLAAIAIPIVIHLLMRRRRRPSQSCVFARVRHRGHDLIAFQVVDRDEVEFDFTQTTPFVGLEGEPMLRVDPRALRSAYLEAITTHAEQLERTTRGFGFDFQRVNTHDWLGPPLATFVARRNAQMKRGKYG